MSFPKLNKPSHLLATFFGIGLLKPAPGTWSSLAAALLWYFLDFLHPHTYVILPIFILCAWLVCIKADQDSESKDNSFIVIDEVVGMFVALSLISHEAILYFCAFLLFRLFDIFKPWPISWVDKNIKGGLGIMLDDLIAGFLAGGIILGVLTNI